MRIAPACIVLLLAVPAHAATMAFPGKSWEEASPESQGLDPAKLAAAIDFLKGRAGKSGVRELAIVRNGRLVWKGEGAGEVHGIWSCTKSFTSAVLGLLIDDGKCRLDTRVAEVIPELAARYPEMTLRHLVTMTSGYRAMGDEPQGGYRHGPSATPFVPSPEPLFAPPGSRYAYWDSAMNLLGLVLTRIAGEPMEELFRRRIAERIGMDPGRWDWGDYARDRDVTVNGGSGNGGKHVTISAREMARLGHLYLNEGWWEWRQLIPRTFVRQAISLQVPASLPWGHPESEIDGRGCYGFNWWVNGETAAGRRKWPGAPPRTAAALGYNNNACFVVPEWAMVIVRLGLDEDGGRISDETWGELLRRVGEAVVEGGTADIEAARAAGPLSIHPTNPRYFTDGRKGLDGSPRAVLLTGSHTWDNLVDMDRGDPPAPFDFAAYLDLLERHGHDFIRLWAWDSTRWDTRANGDDLGKDFVHRVAPLPWARTGPGQALDGGPRFDLTRHDPAWFTRLRDRVRAAGRRGMWVSVMLFEGWGLFHGDRGRAAPEGWAWRSHPFHPKNNVNGIDADANGDGAGREVHSRASPAVNAIQERYVRAVVDALAAEDNVLFEVINEGGGKEWDWWVVDLIHEHQRDKPGKRPVGLTGHGAERIPSMLASRADWVSPGRADGYAEDPPAWNETRPSLLDTDHIWGVGGTPSWVWRSFLRGHNPIFMDPYRGAVLGKPADPRWEPIRRAMGQARRIAERVDLAALRPLDALASTRYCLADPGREYVVYLPEGGEAVVDLSAASGPLRAEWFHPAKDAFQLGSAAEGGARRTFRAPFDGEAVLHIVR